jgi:hypothetical protein
MSMIFGLRRLVSMNTFKSSGGADCAAPSITKSRWAGGGPLRYFRGSALNFSTQDAQQK